MTIRRSPNGAGYTRPQPGRDRSEQVVAINRNQWSQSIGARRHGTACRASRSSARSTSGPRPDWLISGGESGAKRRHSDPAWFRFLREKCRTMALRSTSRTVVACRRLIDVVEYKQFPPQLGA